MLTVTKPIASFCAGDLMSRDMTMVSGQMTLQGAARLLSRAQVNGAPVVDGDGRLVGVLSAVDFLHWAENGGVATPPSCACGDTAWKPWQMLDQPEHAATMVSDVMNRNPVTTPQRTGLIELSRMMVDAHIHRIIVVDHDDKPVGIVTSTDILAALARSDLGHELQEHTHHATV